MEALAAATQGVHGVSLGKGVTRGLPPCVCEHTHLSVPRVDLWLRACVCALVPITAQRTACQGLHTMRL